MPDAPEKIRGEPTTIKPRRIIQAAEKLKTFKTFFPQPVIAGGFCDRRIRGGQLILFFTTELAPAPAVALAASALAFLPCRGTSCAPLFAPANMAK